MQLKTRALREKRRHFLLWSRINFLSRGIGYFHIFDVYEVENWIAYYQQYTL
ncbi:hypothetical protein MIDIC_170027 [Alphaproteobacteria bacterium]